MIDKPYTCNDYRAERILLALEQRLNQPGLSESEKCDIKEEIKKMEAEMGMD